MLKVTSYYHQVMTESKGALLYIYYCFRLWHRLHTRPKYSEGQREMWGKCLCLFNIIMTSVLTTFTVFLPSLVPLHNVAHHWPTCCECAAGCNV